MQYFLLSGKRHFTKKGWPNKGSILPWLKLYSLLLSNIKTTVWLENFAEPLKKINIQCHLNYISKWVNIYQGCSHFLERGGATAWAVIGMALKFFSQQGNKIFCFLLKNWEFLTMVTGLSLKFSTCGHGTKIFVKTYLRIQLSLKDCDVHSTSKSLTIFHLKIP